MRKSNFALIKLYDYTKESQWLDLAKFFIDERGVHEKEEQGDSNIQDHMPVRSQETAEGHAVRACYLYSAMADIALRTNDSELKAACDRIFDNIVNRKMYITGAIGSLIAAKCSRMTTVFRMILLTQKHALQ